MGQKFYLKQINLKKKQVQVRFEAMTFAVPYSRLHSRPHDPEKVKNWISLWTKVLPGDDSRKEN